MNDDELKKYIKEIERKIIDSYGINTFDLEPGLGKTVRTAAMLGEAKLEVKTITKEDIQRARQIVDSVKGSTHMADAFSYATGPQQWQTGVIAMSHGFPKINPHLSGNIHQVAGASQTKDIFQFIKNRMREHVYIDLSGYDMRDYYKHNYVYFDMNTFKFQYLKPFQSNHMSMMPEYRMDKSYASFLLDQGHISEGEFTFFVTTVNPDTSPCLAIHDELMRFAQRHSNPFEMGQPVCHHEWKKDSFFSATVYETCSKCGKKKEEL